MSGPGPAVCFPLGYGQRGEETTVRWRGRDYATIPFELEVPGISPSGGQEPLPERVMILRDRALGRRLRDVVSRSEADALLTILTARDEVILADPDTEIDGRRSPNWVHYHCTRLLMGGSPEAVARLIRLSGVGSPELERTDMHTLSRFAAVTLGELVHVLAVPRTTLLARLVASGGRVWSHV